MPFALRFINQHNSEEVFPIVGSAILLGRSSGDLLIEDTEVSSRHCSIYFSSGELFLQDHNSRNGTFVNSQRVEKVKLHEGDSIRIGSVELRLIEWTKKEIEFLDPYSLVESWKKRLEQNQATAFAQEKISELIGREFELCVNDVQLKMTIEAKDGRLVNHVVPVCELIVGRSGMVPLLAEDDEASRKHARFFVAANGKICVEDLGSANGTFVNEERVSGVRDLIPTDIIRMGKTRIQVFLFLPEFSSVV